MDGVQQEDRELVERVKSGSTEAFSVLVRRYQDRVFNTCWRICGHLEDARDVTQEAFLKVYERIGTFRQESGFYTWLFRVAVNLALTHRRRGRTRREVPLDAIGGAIGTQADVLARRARLAAGEDPAELLETTVSRGRLVQALHALDDDHRAVVVLRDIEGLDYRRIGEILNVPTGTVKSRLYRARCELRRAIEPLLETDELADG